MRGTLLLVTALAACASTEETRSFLSDNDDEGDDDDESKHKGSGAGGDGGAPLLRGFSQVLGQRVLLLGGADYRGWLCTTP